MTPVDIRDKVLALIDELYGLGYHRPYVDYCRHCVQSAYRKATTDADKVDVMLRWHDYYIDFLAG